MPCSIPSRVSCVNPMSEFDEWASQWTEKLDENDPGIAQPAQYGGNNGNQVNECRNFNVVQMEIGSHQPESRDHRDRVNWMVRPKVKDARNKNKGESRMHPAIYANVLAALEKPFSSYSLLYEQPSCLNFKLPDKSSGKRLKLEKKPNSKGWLSNVKTLTGTGLLDGVPVDYVSASGKLPGIINGGSYMCGCQSCNYAKSVNAYEFEQHAGCKTSHPNNHILFPNGKSIFQIVQKLNKVTPETLLLETIQTSIGFSIKQQAYSEWIESFGKHKGVDSSKL